MLSTPTSPSRPVRAVAGAAAASLALMMLPLGAASAQTQAPGTDTVAGNTATPNAADRVPGAEDSSAEVPGSVSASAPSSDDGTDGSDITDGGDAGDGAGQGAPASTEPAVEDTAGAEADGAGVDGAEADELSGNADAGDGTATEPAPVDSADAPSGGNAVSMLGAVPSAQAEDAAESSAASGLPDTDQVPLSDAQRKALIEAMLESTPGANRAHLESLSGEEVDDLWLLLLAVVGDNPNPTLEEQVEAMLSEDWLELLDLLLGEAATDEYVGLVDAAVDGGSVDKLVEWFVRVLGSDRTAAEELVAAMLAYIEDGWGEGEDPDPSITASTEMPTKDPELVVVISSSTPDPTPTPSQTPAAAAQLANTGASAWGPAGLGLAVLAAGGLVLGLRRVRLSPRKH